MVLKYHQIWVEVKLLLTSGRGQDFIGSKFAQKAAAGEKARGLTGFAMAFPKALGTAGGDRGRGKEFRFFHGIRAKNSD